MLALKGNRAGLYEDVKLYFSDEKIRREIQEKKNYICIVEKAHGQLEKGGYYQTENIGWLPQKKEWKGIKASEWKKR